jgi:hypothetical protein
MATDAVTAAAPADPLLASRDSTDLEIAAERACIALWSIIETDRLSAHESNSCEAIRAAAGDALQIVHWTLEELRRATGWKPTHIR